MFGREKKTEKSKEKKRKLTKSEKLESKKINAMAEILVSPNEENFDNADDSLDGKSLIADSEKKSVSTEETEIVQAVSENSEEKTEKTVEMLDVDGIKVIESLDSAEASPLETVSENQKSSQDKKFISANDIKKKLNTRERKEVKSPTLIVSPNEMVYGKINAFDAFFIGLWSFIVMAVGRTADFVSGIFYFIFRLRPPKKYCKAIVVVLLIALLLCIIILPISMNNDSSLDMTVYSDGLLPVMKTVQTESGEKKGLWGFADKSGKLVIDCRFDEAKPFHHGVAFVREGGEWLLINKKGDEKAGRYSHNEGIGIGDFSRENKLAWVFENGKYGFINTKGKLKIHFNYDYAENFSYGRARVKRGVKEFFINESGKIVGDEYDEVMRFSDELAGIKKNGRWGFVDRGGKLKIETNFDKVTHFVGGYAVVKMGSAIGIIDKKGRYYVEPNFDYLIPDSDIFKLITNTFVLGEEWFK